MIAGLGGTINDSDSRRAAPLRLGPGFGIVREYPDFYL